LEKLELSSTVSSEAEPPYMAELGSDEASVQH